MGYNTLPMKATMAPRPSTKPRTEMHQGAISEAQEFVAQEGAEFIGREDNLSPLETEVIDIFVSLVRLVGIPKSVAEIYGLLFVSPQPQPLDAIVNRLRISKGSASQGLKLLRGLGGVRVTYVAGDRRDHYVAETELKKLVAGFIRGEVKPRLENGAGRLAKLKEIAAAMKGSESEREFQLERVSKLNQWHTRSSGIMPLVSGMLED